MCPKPYALPPITGDANAWRLLSQIIGFNYAKEPVINFFKY